jgi:uncharacterized membrane protein
VDFQTTDVIEYPIETVYRAHRDNLPELVDFLPSVESIEVESREEEDDHVSLVNIWKAAQTEVPRVIRPFVKPQMLQWIDRAKWYESERICRWEIELGFLKDAIRVSGQNQMTTTDEGHTKVTVGGTIDVDGRKIPGVPKFMAKKVGAAVESFVVKMVTPNLQKTNDGVRSYIESLEKG